MASDLLMEALKLLLLGMGFVYLFLGLTVLAIKALAYLAAEPARPVAAAGNPLQDSSPPANTVAAIAGASTTVLTGSAAAYHISDTLANAAAGADGLVNGAGEVAAGVEFGAKAADAGKGTAADVVTTTLKYDDLDGKTADKIVLEKADANAHGKAEIVIDASAHATGLTDFVVDDSNNALKDSAVAGDDLTYKFVGTAKADTLTVGKEFAIVDAGAGERSGGGRRDHRLFHGRAVQPARAGVQYAHRGPRRGRQLSGSGPAAGQMCGEEPHVGRVSHRLTGFGGQ